jgi:hypothetical protein
MKSPVPETDPAEFPDPGQRNLSEELTTPSGDFLTQVDINHILGNLFQALAANRVSTKRASTLAYICSTILKSQEGMHDQVRFMELTAFRFLRKALQEKYLSKPALLPKSPTPSPGK